MKKLLKLGCIVICLVLMTAILPGCGMLTSTYEKYENAESYIATSDFSVSTDTVKKVDVNWINGDVEVVSSEDLTNTVMFEESFYTDEESLSKAQDQAFKMHYLIEEDTLIIQYCQSELKYGSVKKKLKIVLPKVEGLELTTDPENVQVPENVLHSLSVKCVSASLTAKDITVQSVDFNTVSGSVLVEDCLMVSLVNVAVSGNVQVKNSVLGAVAITEASGSLTVENSTVYAIVVASVSGNVNVAINNVPLTVEITSMSSTVNLNLPYNSIFKFKAQTKGNVNFGFEYTEVEEWYLVGATEIVEDMPYVKVSLMGGNVTVNSVPVENS